MARLLAVLLLASCAASCVASAGVTPMANSSVTELNSGNFKVVQTGARGEASCSYLFGIIPLDEPAVANRAMNDLVASAGVDGKKRGLVNFAIDVTTANYVVIQILTATVRADVVEYE
jgi:hypothetical protein